MRKLIAVFAVVGMVAGTALSAAAVVPIPVKTSFNSAGWQNGVYSRFITENRQITGCEFIVATDLDGVGETMEAEVDGNPVSAVVQPYPANGFPVYGRASFVVNGTPPFSFETVNTDPIVSDSC